MRVSMVAASLTLNKLPVDLKNKSISPLTTSLIQPSGAGGFCYLRSVHIHRVSCDNHRILPLQFGGSFKSELGHRSSMGVSQNVPNKIMGIFYMDCVNSIS